jgi:hypothetical protein
LGNKRISARNHHWEKAAGPGKLERHLARGLVMLFSSLALLSGCHPDGRQVRAQNQSPSMPERDIDAVLRAHNQELLAIPGVVGVYVGLLADQKTPCLRVMVVKKTKSLEQSIPKSLEGYPVELDETGVIRPMQRPP